MAGKICADGWSDKAANVICRHIGFKGGVGLKYRVYTPNVYWLLLYRCLGNETNINDCDILPLLERTVCSSSREIGVLCYDENRKFIKCTSPKLANIVHQLGL